ncbi:related to GYP1-GTPase activating protein [Sporisorium reilianum SRZ2]|uniref:Related to GYP1-GTPase activating protein n=1 Tax=Sporisorium reilianum (strain SRZ2) TaxID=999809 RepID=E6ZQI3_SPORE|nr:related to GYP1-GTPase activating protein [Sporisorium reilianum SRZ2]
MAPASSSTSSSRGGQARRAGDFDDQAWGIESDDDDFVTQIAPRTNVPRSLKATSRSSSYSSTNQPQQQQQQQQQPSSQNQTGNSTRPHQYSNHPSSSSLQSTSSTSASTSTSAAAAVPIARRDSRNRRTSWTVIDKQRAAPDSLDQTPIAGSPPTDLADAVAAGLALDRANSGGSGAGFQLVDDDPSQLESGSDTEDVDLDTGKTVRRRRSQRAARKLSPGTSEAETLRRSLRPDLDHLVRDPAHALTRLAAQWSSASAHRPSPSTDNTPESVPPPLTTTSGLGVAPTPTKHDFTFDPIAAAGDGLIMTGPSFADTAASSNRELSASSSSASYLDAAANVESADASFSIDGTGQSTNGAASNGSLARKRSVRTSRRRQQLLSCLSKQSVDMALLRTLAWAGVPDELRPIVWQLLLGYLPAVASVRASTLSRKRAEYAAGVELAFAKGIAALDQAIWHQIHIDVPRTNPGIRLWQREATQRSLERILYVWAIRHPASGYVQGINDLATPFFEVFLSAYIDSDPEMFDVALLPANVLEAIEADTFWCLSKLLDGIQDNYIFAQPGIQRQVRRLGELVARIDAPLHAHLQEQNVEYMQFAFRWMNCLLMREMSVRNIIRMWDTYLAEGPDAFSDFHLYVCSVFLHKWTDKLRTMDFQGIIMFLQSLPTQNWSDKDAEMLLSEAFMYKTLFGNTAHLNK